MWQCLYGGFLTLYKLTNFECGLGFLNVFQLGTNYKPMKFSVCFYFIIWVDFYWSTSSRRHSVNLVLEVKNWISSWWSNRDDINCHVEFCNDPCRSFWPVVASICLHFSVSCSVLSLLKIIHRLCCGSFMFLLFYLCHHIKYMCRYSQTRG